MMLLSLVYTELMKYKRTIIPWIIFVGSFLSVITGVLMETTNDSTMSWQTLSGTCLNFLNILALLLVAVITGYVLVIEYQQSTISTLFTYPISRFKIYVVKCFVILLMTLSLYLTFFLFTIFLGSISMGILPSADFTFRFLKIILLVSAANFVLVPVTAVICITFKGVGAYLLGGMGYCIAYISLNSSSKSLFIPVCIPAKLVAHYLISEYIGKQDFDIILIVSIVTFLCAFCIGAVCYSKANAYK